MCMLIAEEAEEAGRHGHTHARCDSSESFLKVLCVFSNIYN